MNHPRILIVEDDYDIRQILQAVFEHEGYLVSSASDGKDALKKLVNRCNPSIILLDLAMPVMNGSDFLLALKEHPEFLTIPIILASEYHYSGEMTGVKAFVRKPFVLTQLLDLTALHRLGSAS